MMKKIILNKIFRLNKILLVLARGSESVYMKKEGIKKE